MIIQLYTLILGFYKNLIYNVVCSNLSCLTIRNLNEQFEKIWVVPKPGNFSINTNTANITIGHTYNYFSTKIGSNYRNNTIDDSLLANEILGTNCQRPRFNCGVDRNSSCFTNLRRFNIIQFGY
jgi:hypothetical protein